MSLRLLLILAVLSIASCAKKESLVQSSARQPTTRPSPYVSNRPPLLPSAFIKLSIGSIEPKGWLRHQLELERNGMVGHLPELSQWCKYEGNAWVEPEGVGHSGWEELPYWLKGYGDLGYVLKDEKIITDTKKWIEATFKTQREDGYFGPRSSLTSLQGKPDMWPNMLMLNVMQSYYEFSSDTRVLDFMTRYFKWQMSVPAEDFMAGYWPKMRAGDNIESIHWLYNRTGEPWLLDVAKKCHDHAADWTSGVINWHGVNITQGFREPANYYVQAKDKKFLEAAERNYATVMDLYGQFPGGMFAADENARKGHDDPRQGAETCSMVEFMHSFEMLTRITGNPIWSDRCEDVAFNSLPAAMTPDLKALHYLTCANQISLDKNNHAPGIENEGTMFSYSPYKTYRCCQHNVAHGWPYFAEEMWLATPDNGLCASLYAPSEVSAVVGDGVKVTIDERTAYPFSDRIVFHSTVERPVKFPLYLRIPAWCDQPIVSVPARASGKYLVVDREWKTGDLVTLRLPMKVSARKWEKNHNSISVDYGPLTFALQIGEKWTRYGGSNAFPEYEVMPTTPWNYGLDLSQPIEVLFSAAPVTAPFTAESAPIKLTAKARRIPDWKPDATGLVAKLQDSPVKSDESLETVTLIPMGAARLRISSFPVLGHGPDAKGWTIPPTPPTASHTNPSDTTTALNDNKIPETSNDHSIPRFTWWDHKGAEEWVQYDFDAPRKISAAEVYWFDDTGAGQCRVPASWQLLYQDGDQWKPVANPTPYGTSKDTFNRTTFTPIQTKSLRLQAHLQPTCSAGILEWKIE
ncbi:MAG TPA: beta-L-arabinofuranosidase domain-containing protein [Tepidisphaeraceae bacterium]|jgi:hypothetical protein|nr:beta-L-arabinofuranosidase domain-containing protein [Tepidisphaeraceae bacterium]